MDKLNIAFDVDDTLIIPGIANSTGRDIPNYEVISTYRWFQKQGHFMIIWSGGGVGYAEMWAKKLGLSPDNIIEKRKNDTVDIAFDDCDVDLAKVNIKVKRLNNNIDRSEWNKHEA